MSILSTTTASNQITVTVNNHGALNGDYVEIQNVISAVGGIPAAEINRSHVVSSVTTNTFVITTTTAASSSATYTSPIKILFNIHTGTQYSYLGYGWGSNAWGEYAWGSNLTNPVIIPARLFTQDRFGNDLIFCIRNGDIYYWDYNNQFTGRAVLLSSLAGAADVPQIVGSILFSQQDRHLLAFGCTEYGSSTYDPLLVRWAAQDAPQFWTPGNVTVPSTGATFSTAGAFRLSNGSEIVAAARTRQEILTFTDSCLYSIRFTANITQVFSLDEISASISIIAPGAVTTVNDTTYWMGVDKFYVYNGTVNTLPCTLRQYVFQDINRVTANQIVSGMNEQFNEVIWFYPSADSTELNRYVIYNYLEGIWYYGTLDRTAWLDSPLRPVPQGAGTDGWIYNHEQGVNDGDAPMESFITSGDIDIEDGEKFMLTRRIIPDINFTGSTAENPQVNMTINPHNFPGELYATTNAEGQTLERTTTASRNETTAVIDQYTNQVFLRLRGRQIKFKISSDTLGVQWQMGMPRVDARPDGQRG